MGTPAVFAHVVTYDSPACTLACLDALAEQESFTLGSNLRILITDNASGNDTPARVEARLRPGMRLRRNKENLGFCGAHNQGVFEFLRGEGRYLLILNPDVRLDRDALSRLVAALESHPEAGCACARLYRADERLEPLEPRALDSAGIVMTPSLRHFDRGYGRPPVEYEEDRYVFGGTGACLLLRRDFVEAMIIESPERDGAAHSIFPQLAPGRAERRELFDEAFFAYREDADLAWRAQLLGWRCLYVSGAIGYHKRVVLATNRSELPAELNRHGVRNRFLLQLNNFSMFSTARCVLEGLFVRNLVVVLGVMLRERSSLRALGEVARLLPRALYRRRMVFAKRPAGAPDVSRWFTTDGYTEPVH